MKRYCKLHKYFFINTGAGLSKPKNPQQLVGGCKKSLGKWLKIYIELCMLLILTQFSYSVDDLGVLYSSSNATSHLNDQS